MTPAFLAHQPNWDETKARFTAWWNRSSLGRPLISVITPRHERRAPLLPVPARDEVPVAERYLNVEQNVARFRNDLNGKRLFGEALPYLSLDLGPGSLALYLGSEPDFQPDTVWFTEVVEDWDTHAELRFDAANRWWQTHLQMLRRAVELGGGEYLVCIPDLVESIDILAAMRGPQAFCYDLLDKPEAVKRRLAQVDDLYMKYFDAMYELVKTPDGGVAYTHFRIWGPGKTAKVQSDFSALMSPSQFREFMLPSLMRQCDELDYSLYHLDGPDAIKHLDAIMEVPGLDALQWTAGAGKADNADPCWYPIHDKVKAAGKALWLASNPPSYAAALDVGNRYFNRYGADGLYMILRWDNATEEEGQRLMDYADTHWKS